MRAALWGPACLAAASWLVAGCGGDPSTAPKVAATSPPTGERAIVSYAVVSDCVHGTEAYIDAVALDGGRAEVPVRFPQNDGGVEYLIGHPAWSPDGTRLLYDLQDWDAWTSGVGAGASGIYVSPVGGRPRRIAAPIGGGAYVSSPTWSPDGRWLAFANLTFVGEDWVSSVWVVRIDGGRLTRLSGQGANDGDPV